MIQLPPNTAELTLSEQRELLGRLLRAKAAEPKKYPLSFAQQRLWFLDQLEPGGHLYNLPVAVRLQGELDVAALEATLNEIIRRHEVLRTRFGMVDGEPAQIVAVTAPHYRLEPIEATEEEARQLARAEAEAPFDLGTGPLLRVKLLRLADEDHVVLFTMHHIISDGWSTSILVREVTALYEAYRKGAASPLPELAIQYADYAAWQREWLQGEVLEEQLSYWRRQLGGELPVLELPVDRARPAVQSYQGAQHSFLIDAEVTEQLKQLSRREDCTLFMTLLAAYQVLLCRYSGQDDVVVGTPIAGRNRAETEPLIGFFVNMLALRTDLSGNPSFVEVMRRVKEAALGGYMHQDLPFEKLVEELQPERDASRSPLFQAVFALHNQGREALGLAGLRLSGLGSRVATSKFELTLGMMELEEGLAGTLEYNTDLYEAETIRRMSEHLRELLKAVATAPEQSIWEVGLVSAAEAEQLAQWNETNTAYEREAGLAELFERQVAQRPAAIAVVYEDEQVSYAELNERANQLAHHLRGLGVGPEVLVGVMLERSVEMIVALLAVLKAGGAYLPLDGSYPLERLSMMVEDAQPAVLLTETKQLDRVPAFWGQVLCLDEGGAWAEESKENPATTAAAAEQLAYVSYTSGSTGQPKGVMVTQRGVVRLVRGADYAEFGSEEVYLQYAPLTFDASTFEIWGSLLHGARLVLMKAGVATLGELAATVRREQVSVLWLTAGLFQQLVESEGEAIAGVRQVLAGGDVLPVRQVREHLQQRRSGKLINGYGPTESTTFACSEGLERWDGEQQTVPIGRPIANTQAYVVERRGWMKQAGVGVSGELYLGGDGLARGYLQRPELTAEKFVPDALSGQAGARLYRTGDLVRYREDGKLEFMGRLDQQVKLRGYRIELGEIEAALGRHNSVEECAVVVRQEADGRKYLVAYVVTKENGDSESTVELKEYLRRELPEFMVPAAIVALESLPLTANGKIDRRKLAAREVHVGSSERSYVPPRTTTEELLCGVWAEVLRAERVGIRDNFFELGGDSILTIQVIVKARALGLELNVQQLFQYQTVHELAQELGRTNESAATVAETIPFSLLSEPDRLRLPAGVADAYPLTVLQAGMLFHSELAPDAGQYHDIFSFHLRLPFDADALHATLQQLIDLHPVLRTSFNFSDFSEPIQLVHEHVEVPLTIEDLRALPAAEQEVVLANWMAAEKQYDFDWREAPLLRFYIHRRAEDSFQFSLSFHHAILDGWSLATMLTGLFNAYAAMQTNERASEASLGASFRDFVAAERAVLNSEKAQQYWAAMLSDATVTRLPRLPQSAGPSRVAGHYVEISAELSDGLKQLARTAGVPVKSVLLAAHLRALNVLTGSNDVMTGLVSHGRPETADGERVLGLFLNTLPFRRRLAGGTWLQLVQETFAAERELLSFRRYPMARMQQDIGNDAPLFEIIFNFVHFHVFEEMENVSGLEVLDKKAVADTNFTLAVDFSLESGGSQIRLALQYDAAELSPTQIAAMGRNYLTILESMTRSPHEHYERQCLLTPEERQRILYDWNVTPDLNSECYIALLEAQVARTPNALAAVLDSDQLTYDELNRRANQLAHYLRATGVGPEVPVGVLLERSLETIVALLAICKAGGAYVPLDPEYPDERLRFMMRDAGVELVVTQERLSSRLADPLVKVIRMDVDWPEIANESCDNPQLLNEASNLAYIIYTSGSTGTPKGAMVTQGGVLNCLQWMQQRYELTEHDGFLMHTSMNFDPSVWEVFWPLMVGGRVVIASSGMLESSALLSYMAEQSVSCAYFVPSQLGALVQDRRLSEVTGLRYVISGGEKLSLAVMREFQKLSGAELHHSYGPTETAIAATEWTCEADAERVLMGRPTGNMQVYVLDGHAEPLPVGVTGELYIGGTGVGRGYAGQAALTAEKFVPDAFSGQAGARLYRTGDMVRYDEEGNLEFVGRLDQQVKLRGYRIELGEIEAALMEQEAVREAVVIARSEEQRLVGYVVSESGVEVEELRQALRAKLPEYMVPSALVVLDELPLTVNGKLDRKALPAPEGSSGKEYVGPRTPVEEVLAGIFGEVLGLAQVSIDDNFFELGGHSLLATQVISRVRESFGVELGLRKLFESPTVAGLSREVTAAMNENRGSLAPPIRVLGRDEKLPLSFAQQRLWFLDQLEPGSAFYNSPLAVRLTGALNLAAFEQTLSEIVRRHESLRTRFVSVDGQPRQVIDAAEALKLTPIELSELPESEREAAARRLAKAEAEQPFDLSTGPLLRVQLLRLADEEHVVLFTMHHIISDGWSLGVLVKEVAALYEAYIKGEESPLPELAIQYADYAAWQREWLQGEVLEEQLSYWRRQLGGELPVLELPADKPRPAVQSYRGSWESMVISAELTQQLKALSQREGCTLFMTLLAAFQVLLCRYSGQEDIVVGTPIANRTRTEIEPLIGFFINTLALRTDMSGNPSFSQLLKRVREVTLGGYAHQDIPFEKLVEELQPDRDVSRSPLFQVMFVVQNAPSAPLQLPGLKLSALGGENNTSKFDLSVSATEHNGRLHIVCEYSTDLFEPPSIERLLGHYQRVLEEVSTNSELRVGEIRLLDEAQERQLVEWNETKRDYEQRGQCLHQLIEAQTQNTPDAVAVIHEDEQLSYGELNERANQLAHHLRGLGVGPDVLVGLCLERSLEMIVGVLAVLKAGGAYVPLDPAYPQERLAFMLADATVSVLLTESRLLAQLPVVEDLRVVCVDADRSLIAAQRRDNPESGVGPDNLAYVIYTSGSTGQPKGVMVCHASVVNYAAWLTAKFEIGPGDRVLQFASINFDTSAEEIYGSLLRGASLVLRTEDMLSSISVFLAKCAEWKVSVLELPTAFWHELTAQLASNGLELPDSIRVIYMGGEKALSQRLAQWQRQAGQRVRLANGYGPTETTIVATMFDRIEALEQIGDIPIGRPVSNVQAYVVDHLGQRVPPGIAGELHIGGEGVARGYLKRPELTAEKFIPDPFSGSEGARLYRTGDLVRYRGDGNLEFMGRVDQQVKLRGYRIELGEIEAALIAHEAVREAVVIARAQEQRLVGYVVSEDGVEVKVDELRQALRGKLPEYMVPSALVVLEALPLTPNGKLDRRALPEPNTVGNGKEYVAPRTPAEEVLAGIYGEVLGLAQVSSDDNFFDLGGHSLLATQLISRVRESFRVELPLRAVFESPTVIRMAAAIEKHSTSDVSFQPARILAVPRTSRRL